MFFWSLTVVTTGCLGAAATEKSFIENRFWVEMKTDKQRLKFQRIRLLKIHRLFDRLNKGGTMCVLVSVCNDNHWILLYYTSEWVSVQNTVHGYTRQARVNQSLKVGGAYYTTFSLLTVVKTPSPIYKLHTHTLYSLNVPCLLMRA